MKIVLGLDPGASLTKVIADVEGEKELQLLFMPPEVVDISRVALDNYRAGIGKLGNPRPEDEAYVEWEDQIYLVGSFARDFSGDAGFKQLKYERAIYKTLAAVGVIASRAGLLNKTPVNITLSLAILLPWNEYEDRKKFQDRLTKVLADYSFRGHSLKVKIECFMCRPEGSGLALIQTKLKGMDWFRDRTFAILMFGHRNVTALQFSGGRMVSGESPELGFMKLESKVLGRTSGLKPFELSKAIFQANQLVGKKVNNLPVKLENTTVIQNLARSEDPEFRSKEIKEIASAITSSRDEYWRELERWLNRCLPKELDEVIICGGVGIYFKAELEEYFGVTVLPYRLPEVGKRNTPISWGADITEQVEATFDKLKTERHQKEALAFRLIDIFGLFTSFNVKVAV